MKRRILWLLILVILFSASQGVAQHHARFSLLEDSTLQSSPAAAVQLYNQGRFQQQRNTEFNPGFTRSVFWLAVSVDSAARSSARRLLIGNPHINRIDFYKVEGGQPRHQYLTGDHFPFRQRPIETVNFSFPLPDEAGLYLLRIDKHHESLQLTYRITTADELALSESRQSVITGILTGVIILLLVFGIYLAVITRQRVYVLYILYVASGWLWVLADLGFGFKYLWPDNAWFASRARPVFSELTIILSIQYLLHYMGGVRWKLLGTALRITTIIASALLLVWLAPVDVYDAPALAWIMLKVIPAIAALYVILGIAALISEAKRNNKMALFYLGALIPLMLLVFINLLNHSGIIDITGSSLEHYGVAVGYVCEVVILTFGLAYSFNRHRVEKEGLQLKLALQQKENARALIETEARERKRIADELHDIAGSMLSAARLNISSVRESNLFSNNENALRLQKADEALNIVSNSVRNLSHALSPIMLQKLGLRKSIENAASFFSSSGKLNVELAVIGFEEYDPALENIYTTLYSITYEFLNNVVKHSGANSAIIQLVEHEDSINLMVEDNGKGLPQAEHQPQKGLSGIISKINYYNGTIAFDNTGTGLVISIEIPKLSYEKTGSTG